MDSPESSKPTNIHSACETAPVQDSPVFSYLSDLSPIQSVKAPSVTQGFPGLNSPPLVFKSPRLNLQSQPTSLKRVQYPRNYFAKFQEQFDNSKNNATNIKGNENLDIQLSTGVVACGDKATYSSISSVDHLIQSPSGSHKQFLEDIGNVESPDSKSSFDSTIKTSEQTDHQIDALTCSKEILVKLEHEHNTESNDEAAVAPPVDRWHTEELQNENILINISAAENDLRKGDGVSVEHSTTIAYELPAVNAVVNQDEDNFTTELQNAESGISAALDQSSCIITGQRVKGKEIENFVVTTGATLSQPTLTEFQNDLKAFQNRGTRRRCLQFENAEHSVICNRPAQDSSDSEGKTSPSLEPPLMPSSLKPHARNTLDSSIKIPKPSGFGLHLNSVVNAVQAGSSALVNVKTAQWDCVSATTDGKKPESHACVPVGSAMVLPNDSVILNSKANQPALGNKRIKTEKGSRLEGINNLSPKKKRINAMDSGDGCKHCNCKRSKCLKLYCDCFAAGIYCAEPCSCQQCFNRPEHKDKVIETRQKIEARDPFAFAPRVVKQIIEEPSEDMYNYTPASARHKKGCKCKKSRCLKKYCECCRSNVGCSDGCRCEGCENVYGQKGENVMTKVVLTGEDAQETTDVSFVENCEMAAASGSHSHTYHPELVTLHNLIPPTPTFQLSNHGKEASKARFPSGKYIQTPVSGFTYVSPYMVPLGTPRNSDNNVTIPDDILDQVCFDKESHHGNPGTVDEFSAAYPQSGKMEHLYDISNPQKWGQSFSTKKSYLSGTSLVWHGSPITPMARFGGMQAAKFDGLSSNSTQDDTPEILKNTSTPLNIVKAGSPNKKRVSPPHHELSSSSSVGIRTRKFILKAVPSFPPLTPCIDSKTPGMQQDNIPKNHIGENK